MKQTPRSSEPPAVRKAGPSWLILIGAVAAVAVAAVVLYPAADEPDEPAVTAAPPAGPAPVVANTAEPTRAPAVEQTGGALKPNLDTPLPPLPFSPQMARPVDVVRTAYEFVGRHPEVSNYVPCFCGCENGGHRSNENCFVQARTADGNVAAWDAHGLHCALCIDVARDSAQLHASGASVKDIRKAIDTKYASYPSHTPTPQPQ